MSTKTPNKYKLVEGNNSMLDQSHLNRETNETTITTSNTRTSRLYERSTDEQYNCIHNDDMDDTGDGLYRNNDESDGQNSVDNNHNNDGGNGNNKNYCVDSIGNNKNSNNIHKNNANGNNNGRKGRRHKRYQNLNKHKKWNKQFKRQKSHMHNNQKSEAENIQINRNKHVYGGSKVPKLFITNKTIAHRGGLSKFFLPEKRPRKDVIVPPTKFLLGGNISDPLNLNSLQDEALASMNAATPKSSPITTPPKIDVLIPPNIHDPLHLLDPVDSIEYEKQLISPMKQRRLNKHRNRKKKPRKHAGSISPVTFFETSAANTTAAMTNTTTISTTTPVMTSSVATTSDLNTYSGDQDSAGDEFLGNTDDDDKSSIDTSGSEIKPKEKLSRDLHLDLSGGSSGRPLNGGRKRKSSESNNNNNNNNNNGNANNGKNKLRRMDSMDKIVSPVIPQPGAWKRPPKILPMGAPRNRNRTQSTSIAEEVVSPTEEQGGKRVPEMLDNEKTDIIEQAQVPDIICTSATTSNVPSTDCDSTSPIIEISMNTNKSEMGSRKPTFKKENIKYQYGNYTGPYGGIQELFSYTDVRLTVFMRHGYLFRDKDVLDIGCNAGHMTIAVARKLHPKSVMGIDIDSRLIARARKNLSLFVRIPSENHEDIEELSEDSKTKIDKCDITSDEVNVKNVSKAERKKIRTRQLKRDKCQEKVFDFFPISFPVCYGGIPNFSQNKTPARTQTSVTSSQIEETIVDNVASSSKDSDSGGTESQSNSNVVTCNVVSSTTTINKSIKTIENITAVEKTDLFPNNVFFRTLNYAVTDEAQLNTDMQQYDLIMCLSVTKWIHLNFGDAGLKMTFKRMFNQLRPGGKLILEAQNWASYKKRKKLTETIFNNYKNIEFFPNNFHEYLLSPEVGFSHSYALGVPRHSSKGFYRPIQLYVKGDFTPSQIRWSDSYHPQTPYEPYRYRFYADTKHLAHKNGSIWKRSGMGSNFTQDAPYASYRNRFNTPSHGISSSTSQYYNPLETDSYLPSYDNEVRTRHYCFASPLYSTVWSPPASGRKSASQTPLFGSIRRVNDADDAYGSSRRHVYPPTGSYDGSGGSASTRSIDEGSYTSPQTNHVYAIGSSRSVRDIDLDTNTNSPKEHVYATSTANCCDNSSSPQAGPSDHQTESPSHHYSGESSRSAENEQEEHNGIEED